MVQSQVLSTADRSADCEHPLCEMLSAQTDAECHERGTRDTEERDETRLAKRPCLAAPSISPSPSLSPPPLAENCPLKVISGDQQTFYVDRPMICAASTFIRNALTDTHCEELHLPLWSRRRSRSPRPDTRRGSHNVPSLTHSGYRRRACATHSSTRAGTSQPQPQPQPQPHPRHSPHPS